MKFLFVLNHYLPEHVAGTEVYTSLLSRFLVKEGHDVHIVVPNYQSTHNSFYKHDDIPVYKYAEPSSVDRDLILGKRKPEGLDSFEKLLIDLNPDVVHFHELAGSNGITIHHVKRTKVLGYKVVFTAHVVKYSCKRGNLMLDGRSLCNGIIDIKRCAKCILKSRKLSVLTSESIHAVANTLYKFNINTANIIKNGIGTALAFPFLVEHHQREFEQLYQYCDKLVVLTKWYHSILQSNLIESDKICIIPQTLPHLETQLTEQPIRSGYPIKLLFIGRISEFKGVHLLIKALEGLPEERIQLCILGQETEDDYYKYCRNLSKGMNNIQWGGRIEPSEVIKRMQQFDALCLPSTINEMSPLVIQEAFAAGLPVIASDVYGNAEQITHNENGLLFKINEISSLRSELVGLIENPERLNSLSCNIKKPESFKKAGNLHLDLYRGLFAQK